MRLGYKAHEGSYNALGGTNRMAGRLLDQRRYSTYKALKLQVTGAGGDRVVTRGGYAVIFEPRRGDFYMTGGKLQGLDGWKLSGWDGIGSGGGRCRWSIKAGPRCHSGMYDTCQTMMWLRSALHRAGFI